MLYLKKTPIALVFLQKGINSVLKIDKKVFPQAYLEQCKSKSKK